MWPVTLVAASVRPARLTTRNRGPYTSVPVHQTYGGTNKNYPMRHQQEVELGSDEENGNSLRCPDRVVHLVSCSFSAEYGLSAGGLIRRSLTSAANSGAKDETTWSNLERWDVIRLQANCASTWANHTSGSAGQKGGSFRVTTAEMSPEVGVVIVAAAEEEECEPEVRGMSDSSGLLSESIARYVRRASRSPM